MFILRFITRIFLLLAGKIKIVKTRKLQPIEVKKLAGFIYILCEVKPDGTKIYKRARCKTNPPAQQNDGLNSTKEHFANIGMLRHYEQSLLPENRQTAMD